MTDRDDRRDATADDTDTDDPRENTMDDTDADTDTDDARTARRETPPARSQGTAPQGGARNATQGSRGHRPVGSSNGPGGLLDRDPRELIYWAGLLTCGLLALVALVTLYTSVLDVIRTWVDPEYRSLFRSAFSLVVLVAAVLGVSLTVRELSE